MLTLKETRWSLNAFKILSILNILPIRVEVKSGKIQRESCKLRIFLWRVFFGVGVSHWIYMMWRLVQSTILEPQKYFRWDHFIIHFGLGWGAGVCYFTGFCLFVKTPEETVMIFNQLFSEREDPVQKIMERQLQLESQLEKKKGKQASAKGHLEESQNEVDSEVRPLPRPRPLLTWPPQYSLEELLAKLHPLLSGFMVLFTLLFVAADPSRCHLLYSSLPSEWKTGWNFLSLLAVEALCTCGLFCFASLSVVTQILFFGKCQSELEGMKLKLRNLQGIGIGIGGRDFRREMWILRQISMEMRELVLLIELFNRCFPLCIFAWKILSLALAVMGYFFVIRHFEDFPALAVLIGYIATVMTLVYTIAYGHAFSIPGKIEDLKKEFLLTAQKITTRDNKASTSTSTSTSTENGNANANSNGNKNLRAEMKREMKRIQGVGIKVGSFHLMERESTPNFVNFVVNQVVTLLFTFPR